MANQFDYLQHELVNLMGDWLTQADQANTQQQEPPLGIPLEIWQVYTIGYEAGLRQAIKDLSKLLQDTRRE